MTEARSIRTIERMVGPDRLAVFTEQRTGRQGFRILEMTARAAIRLVFERPGGPVAGQQERHVVRVAS